MSHLDIAAQKFKAGETQSFVSDVLDEDAERYRIRLFHQGEWPEDQTQEVLLLFVDETFDDGAHWRQDLSATIHGGAWHTRDGKSANNCFFLVDVSHPGVKTRKLRVTLTARANVNVGIRVFSE